MELLHISPVNHLTKATDHINEQIALIETLEAKGFTYIIDDGVYFDTSKFEGYAAFARLDLDDLQAGARVAYNTQKRNNTDFALWKFSPLNAKRDMEWWAPWQSTGNTSDETHAIGSRATRDGEMQGTTEQLTKPYDTYGEGAAEVITPQIAVTRGSYGFPGWHIECSAMAMKYLGATLDIHTGGIDHVPIHHTNEIAQSEAATGQRFVNHWLHSNHVTVNGEKISKSLGNGIRLQEIIDKGISAEAVRLHILESHYRSQSKFSWESLEAAGNRLRAYQAMADHKWQAHDDGKVDAAHIARVQQTILTALQNDLDTPRAVMELSQIEGDIDNCGITMGSQEALARFLAWLDAAFELQLSGRPDITGEQKELLTKRTTARDLRDWATSDELRDTLLAQGITIRDTPNGAIWSRA